MNVSLVMIDLRETAYGDGLAATRWEFHRGFSVIERLGAPDGHSACLRQHNRTDRA